MKQKIKNLKRRWRKLAKNQRRLIAFLAVLAVIDLSFSPLSTLWLSVIVFYEVLNIIQLRKEQYYFYCMGRSRSRDLSIYMLGNRIRLLDELMESTNKYADLLLKYNNLRAAHNKLLRRRRKENNQ